MIGAKLELANCEHDEKVISTTDGLPRVICSLCGQRRRFKQGDDYSTVITLLGRKDGAIVMPPVATALELTPEESRFVKEGWDIVNQRPPSGRGFPVAKRASKPTPEPTPEPIPEPTPELTPEPAPEPAPEPTVTGSLVPPKPRGRKQQKVYWEENKEAVIADYHHLKLLPFFKRWHLASSTWQELKIDWEVAPKATMLKKKRTYIRKRPLTWWKENREEVQADYLSMTTKEFFKTWHISSTFWIIIRDFLKIPLKSHSTRPGDEALAAGALPVFPAFNNSWLPTVQEAWFKAFLELKKLEVK